MGGVALTGSECSCPAKAWPASFTVAGLRRCLIIFAPRTLILDRRTCTCRTPSLQWIWQRSKNFTSGAPISFTPNGPIGYDRWVQATGTGNRGPHAAARPEPATTGSRGPKRWTCGNTHQVAQSGPQGQHNSNATLGRCLDVPWMGIQPSRGCFEHTEFSRVSLTVGSGGGRGLRLPSAGLGPPWCPWPVREAEFRFGLQ